MKCAIQFVGILEVVRWWKGERGADLGGRNAALAKVVSMQHGGAGDVCGNRGE